MAQTALSPAEVGVKVGDFFVSSWGYDQTNVDFYKVVALTAKGVKVQQWSSKVVDGNDGPHDSVVPGDGPAMFSDWSAATPEMDYWERQAARKDVPAPVEQKRLKSYGYASDSVAFTVNSYSSASKWDGRPKYQTGQGYGH